MTHKINKSDLYIFLAVVVLAILAYFALQQPDILALAGFYTGTLGITDPTTIAVVPPPAPQPGIIAVLVG